MLAILLTISLQTPVELRPARADKQEAPANPAPQEAKPTPGGKDLKVFATGSWQYVRADPNGPRESQQLVIRSAKELADRPPFNKLDAPAEVVEKMATAALAKALKVDAIDWTKQMVVVVTAGVKPTGGYRVEITKATQADKTVTVHWKLHTPKGAVTQAFTHPAQAALIERVDGEVRFDPPAAKSRGNGK